MVIDRHPSAVERLASTATGGGTQSGVAKTTPRVTGLAGLLFAACDTSQYQSGGREQCSAERSAQAP